MSKNVTGRLTLGLSKKTPIHIFTYPDGTVRRLRVLHRAPGTLVIGELAEGSPFLYRARFITAGKDAAVLPQVRLGWHDTGTTWKMTVCAPKAIRHHREALPGA